MVLQALSSRAYSALKKEKKKKEKRKKGGGITMTIKDTLKNVKSTSHICSKIFYKSQFMT